VNTNWMEVTLFIRPLHSNPQNKPKISVREAIEKLCGICKDEPGTVDDFLLQRRIEHELELARENPSVEDDYYAELARRGLSS